MLQGSIRSLEAQLEKFNSVPSIEGLSMRYQLGFFFLFVLFIGIVITIAEATFGTTNSIVGLLVLLFPMLIGAVAWRYFSAWADLAIMRNAKASDDEVITPASENYLGVAYCNGIWGYRGDTSWDRGYLVFAESGLQFAGHASFFELPFARILNVRVHHAKHFLGQGPPRLFVDWQDWTGKANTLSFEVRLGRTTLQIQRENKRLAEELYERWQLGINTDYRKDVELPFRSSNLDFSVGPEQYPILEKERNQALAWSAIFLILTVSGTQYIVKVLKFDVGVLSGVFGVMSIYVYSGVVLSLVRRRTASLNDAHSTAIPFQA